MEPSNRSAIPHVAIIIPALNEEIAIGAVLKDIPRGIAQQVIVVDNGSRDRTSEIAAQSGAQVVREPQRGYGSACLAGIKALSSEIEIVVFMDGDHSDHPEQLPNLLNPIFQGGADFVLGTRSTDQHSAAALTLLQRWGNRLATSLMRRFWGCDYTDLGPLRAIRRDSLESLSMSDPDFGWTVEMQIKAAVMGLRILETPVSYRARIGKSKVSGTLKGSILAGAKILFTIFSYAFLDRTRRNGRRELCVR
ncbi:MAG: glycosyltransferase family 2 protein [Acidobacteriaceae bacterium]